MANLRGGTTIAGYIAWHSGNMGANSGLNADLIDGKHLSSLAQLDTSNVFKATNSVTVLQVQKSDATVVFDVDTTNGRVGVMNAAPGYALDVTGDINATLTIRTPNLRLTQANGSGIRFWDTSDDFKIWMSATSDATWGARLDSTSDYNMYFRMTGGTNRGFVFKNGTTNIASINPDGFRSIGAINLFQPSTNTTTALQVAQAAGTVVLDVDTTNKRVGINNTAPGYDLDVTGNIRATNQLTLSVATGTSPLLVTSKTLVANLNADLLDGNEASAFATSGHTHANDHAPGSDNQNVFTTLHALTSGGAEVTNSPYTVASKTDAINLKAGANITLSMSGSTITIDASGITDTNTASAVDNILDGSNSGTAITYAPYAAQQAKLSFDTSATDPTRSDRLNLNGYLYATKLYSGGVEVVTGTHTHPYLPLAGGTVTGDTSFTTNVTANNLTATNFNIGSSISIQYDATTGSIDFVYVGV